MEGIITYFILYPGHYNESDSQANTQPANIDNRNKFVSYMALTLMVNRAMPKVTSAASSKKTHQLKVVL